MIPDSKGYLMKDGRHELVYSLFIPKMFPSLNEIIEVRSSSWHGAWNELKRMCASATIESFKQQTPGCRISKELFPLHVIITCYEWADTRDVPNMGAGAEKPILDALSKSCGLIPDDSKKFVEQVTYRFRVAETQQNVGVLVEFWRDPTLKPVEFPKGREREVKNRLYHGRQKTKRHTKARAKKLKQRTMLRDTDDEIDNFLED